MRVQRSIDANNNGMGEYAFFAELAGTVGLRDDESGGISSEQLAPPLLSAGFGEVQGSRVMRSVPGGP